MPSLSSPFIPVWDIIATRPVSRVAMLTAAPEAARFPWEAWNRATPSSSAGLALRIPYTAWLIFRLADRPNIPGIRVRAPRSSLTMACRVRANFFP